MLRLMGLEELNLLILEIPALVDLQEDHSAELPDKLLDWLRRLEKSMENNRLPIVGSIASIRSGILATNKGMIPPGVGFQGRLTRRKIRQATAALALEKATTLLMEATESDRARLDEAARVCNQIVARGMSQGLLPVERCGQDLSGYLGGVWRLLSESPALKEYATHVVGLVGPTDALALLDRSLSSHAA